MRGLGERWKSWKFDREHRKHLKENQREIEEWERDLEENGSLGKKAFFHYYSFYHVGPMTPMDHSYGFRSYDAIRSVVEKYPVRVSDLVNFLFEENHEFSDKDGSRGEILGEMVWGLESLGFGKIEPHLDVLWASPRGQDVVLGYLIEDVGGMLWRNVDKVIVPLLGDPIVYEYVRERLAEFEGDGREIVCRFVGIYDDVWMLELDTPRYLRELALACLSVDVD